MHRARQHAETRLRERRRRLANEAARLMAESGIRDYQQAKRKAAIRLGIADDASLPGNREIEDALREYQRLFLGDDRAIDLRQLREAAARALEFFAAFHPRLVGPVLDGLADARTAIALQVHVDDPDDIARFLEEHRIPADLDGSRVRLDRQRIEDATVWRFVAGSDAIELTVLPMSALRQAPLSAVDDKPVRRASLPQLRQLLADEDIAAYEADNRKVARSPRPVRTAPADTPVSGPGCPGRNVPRGRCRSAAAGRCGLRDRSAAPANARPSRRSARSRTSP